MKIKKIRDQVVAAKTAIEAAESQLDKTLKDVSVTPRAEKKTISSAVEAAFVKLRAAKAELVALEKAITEEDT